MSDAPSDVTSAEISDVTSDVILVLVTLPTAERAAALARALVEEGLAACGNVVPGLRSIYRWEGQVHDEPEALLLLKSRAPVFEALRERVVALHPYQCPEVLRLDVAGGHAPYLRWILENVRAGGLNRQPPHHPLHLSPQLLPALLEED